MEEILTEILKANKYKKGKKLGEGGDGLAYEVIKNNKTYAAKLIKLNPKAKECEADIIKEFRGPNIVKFNYVEKKTVANSIYYLIVMEKATFNSLAHFLHDIRRNNILDIIYGSSFQIIGDNLLRFFISQLIQGLEILNRNNFCHFDIKPQNILVFQGLYIKWADFGYLRDLETIAIEDKNNNNNNNDGKKIDVPGGTRGYFSPEFYLNKGEILLKQAFKHDYFGLGATIYYMKYGKNMLNYYDSGREEKDYIMTSNQIIEQIEKKMDEIKSDKSSDKEFIDLLCSLIQYSPEQRPDLESMYKNKWLNKNREEINSIVEINDTDAKKILMEINKSDFLIKKKMYLDSIHKKNNEKNKYRKFKFNLEKNSGKFIL